jgi:hypothetical protein
MGKDFPDKIRPQFIHWLNITSHYIKITWGRTRTYYVEKIRHSPGLKIAKGSLIGLAILLFLVYMIPLMQEAGLHLARKGAPKHITYSPPEKFKSYFSSIEREKKSQARKLEALTPQSAFLIVNTFENRIWLYRNRKMIREGICSTGSYIMLQSGEEQKWIFKTPRGMFRVQGKTTSPVWHKPDWAFVEDGLPIPSPYDPSRYEYGVLGDYALSIGDGYMIHGTLYKRFLGMPVTHGCIRLSDEDLKAVYTHLDIGSRVYIY